MDCSMRHWDAKEAIDKQLEVSGVDDAGRRQWILMNLTRDSESGGYRNDFAPEYLMKHSNPILATHKYVSLHSQL